MMDISLRYLAYPETPGLASNTKGVLHIMDTSLRHLGYLRTPGLASDTKTFFI